MVVCFEGRAQRGRRRTVSGFRQRGRQRLCATGVSFFAGITRRVHAPLALVGDPLRGMLTSHSISSSVESSLRAVRLGAGQLLSLIGRLLSFQGARARNFRLGFIRYSISRLLRGACGHFGPLTHREKLTLDVRAPRDLCTSISERKLAGVVDGLLAGTVGCSRACVHVELCSRNRELLLSMYGSNLIVPMRVHRRVFGPFVRCGANALHSIPNANVKLTLTHSLTRLRRNALYVRSSVRGGYFLLSLPLGRRRAITVRRGRPMANKRSSRRDNTNATLRRRQCALLIIRSDLRVRTFIIGRLSSRCHILATIGKIRTLGILGRRAMGLIVSSVVVPRVSKLRLYRRLGSRLSCDRVPVVLLATGAALRTGVRKVGLKTSMCVRGPFSIRCLGIYITGLLGGHRGLQTSFIGSPFIRANDVTVAGTSRSFLGALGRIIITGVRGPSFYLSSVTDLLGVDQSDLGQGVGNVLSVAPGSCVHLRQLGGTTRLLGRKRYGVGRIYCVANFGAPSCFAGYFRGRFNVLPGSFIG